jgi:hypothetical protein
MFQRTRKPAFAIAFVTIRSFIPFSQSYSRFGIVRQSSLKVFSRISLQFLKFVGQNLQTEKLSRICRAEWSSRICRAELSSRICRAELSSRVVGPSCRAEWTSRVVEPSCRAELFMPSFSCRKFAGPVKQKSQD